MKPDEVEKQLDALIDDLLKGPDVSCSSLVSILTAARDAVRGGYHVALARKIWDANRRLKTLYGPVGASPVSYQPRLAPPWNFSDN